MRPRVFPAEDQGGLAISNVGDAAASMRPRVFPAEDPADLPGKLPAFHASMRPRVFPAEDSGLWNASTAASWCFNEAAGIPRGRPLLVLVGVNDDDLASMRPRVFPAEDYGDHLHHANAVNHLQ